MLDKGLSTNICESMKARFIPGSPSHVSGSSPPSLSGSPPSLDPENNLNKSGGEKGMYFDKPVLNIDHQNYTLKTPNGRGASNTSPDQVLVNVTSPSEQRCFNSNNHACSAADIRLGALTCHCRTSGSPSPTSAASGAASIGCRSCNISFTHKLSSLLPLLECKACFHHECAPYCNSHQCKRLPPDGSQANTLPKDVVSTFLLF